jgi:Tectonin domain/Proprotein convertase P-domain/Putative Ig domain
MFHASWVPPLSLRGFRGRRTGRWWAMVGLLATMFGVSVVAAGRASADSTVDQALWTQCVAQSSASLWFDATSLDWLDSTTLHYSVVVDSSCTNTGTSIVEDTPQLNDNPQTIALGSGGGWIASSSLSVTPLRSATWRVWVTSVLGRAELRRADPRDHRTASVTMNYPQPPLRDSPPTFIVTDNSVEQRREFVQAVETPGTTVIVAGNVNLDLSGLDFVNVAPGVQILGDRSVNPLGPLLFTTTEPSDLFHVGRPANPTPPFSHERISGIRLRGGSSTDPFQNMGEEDSNGILVQKPNVEIDHNEISLWRGTGVEVMECSSNDACPAPDILSRPAPGDTVSTVWIHDNYIHHDQHPTGDFGGGHGGGYGVESSHGGYALVEQNVFDSNRHSIAAGFQPGTGYLFYRNLILPNGGDNTQFTHTHAIDVHGSNKDDSYESGAAGEYFDVQYNTVEYSNGADIKLRGIPSIGMDIGNNVFGRDDQADAIEFTELQPYVEPGNTYRFDAAAHTVNTCDFDGDGTIDPFLASGQTWWYQSSRLAGRYVYLAQSSAQTSDAILRDVTGDGLCDVTVGGVVHQTPDAQVLDSINLDGSPIATALRPDGGVEVFGTNVEDQVWHNGQTTPGGALAGGWTGFDGSLRSITAETDTDGRIEVAGIDSTGRVRLKWQTAAGGSYVAGWADWGAQAKAIASARDADGRLELFIADAQGNLSHRYQNAAGGGTGWSDWIPMDGYLTQLAAQTNADGLIELFGVNRNGQIWHRTQTAKNSTTWTAWSAMDGALTSVSLALNKDGRMELFGANAQSVVFHRVQTTPGTWNGSTWQTFDGLVSQVAAETDSNGRIALYAVNSGGYIYSRIQPTAGSWTGSGWTGVPGMLRPTHPVIPAQPMQLDPLYDHYDQAGTQAFPDFMSAQLGTPPYRWTITGLPPGLALQPDNNITGIPTAPGVYPVTVSVTDHSVPPATITRSFTWTVNPGPCWPGFNDHRTLQIPDLSTVAVDRYNGCLGNASATSTVSVNITHTYIGDLVIDLIAPSGRVYNLRNRAGGSADNLIQTYTLDLSAEPMQGMWRLQIQDAAAQDSGQLNSWSLLLR